MEFYNIDVIDFTKYLYITVVNNITNVEYETIVNDEIFLFYNLIKEYNKKNPYIKIIIMEKENIIIMLFTMKVMNIKKELLLKKIVPNKIIKYHKYIDNNTTLINNLSAAVYNLEKRINNYDEGKILAKYQILNNKIKTMSKEIEKINKLNLNKKLPIIIEKIEFIQQKVNNKIDNVIKNSDKYNMVIFRIDNKKYLFNDCCIKYPDNVFNLICYNEFELIIPYHKYVIINTDNEYITYKKGNHLINQNIVKDNTIIHILIEKYL